METMSWFDTTGLASLAKNALKEAQKTIDKALDIKDEDPVTTAAGTIPLSTASPAMQRDDEYEKSKTEPSTPLNPMRQSISNPALWGSFTGSFFENPKAGEMVTTPPKCGITAVEQQPSGGSSKRQSVHSNSDSVELLSPPTTPYSGSGMTSPSIATAQNSESVEVITTPTSDDILSSESAKSPDSVEVITTDELFEDDDEDSMSFTTVMDDTAVPIGLTIANSTVGLPVKFIGTENPQQTDSCESVKTLIETTSSSGSSGGHHQQSISSSSFDETLIDSQTALSDSTQSFEDVHIPEPNSDDKELVKIPSGTNSGHTSADEVETTTSSDIEIISNPNGDSSSTNSACRTSPHKLQSSSEKKSIQAELKTKGKKGHCREPSGASTQSDDSQLSNQSETDKLLRRISELSEILEAREQRLLEIGRQNAELQEKNAQFQSILEANQNRTEHVETEEYTQRLSALEKKFQMSIRERDALRDQLKAARQELSDKIAKDDMEKIVAEKDYMIAELKNEGEKLSKQILQHSNITKKLRSKERESDLQLKKNREQIAELSDEVERLKKSLMAKEEVERSQIEAVHKLSSDRRKLDKENQTMKSHIEDLSSKLETVQTSLEAAKRELHDKNEARFELSRKTEALANLETEKLQTQTQNAEILHQLETLREKLRISEAGNTHREQNLRLENSDLQRRLEAAEIRAEELTQAVGLATIPLARQLEAIQTTLRTRAASWENQEMELLANLDDAQKKLNTLENLDTESKNMKKNLTSRINILEERLSLALLKNEQSISQLQQTEVDFSLKETDYKREIDALKVKLSESLKEVEELQRRCVSLEKNIELEEELYKKHISQTTNQKTIANDLNCSQSSNTVEACNDLLDQNSGIGDSSPTLSLGRNSIADSLGSSAWQMDDLECISNSGRQMIGGVGGGGSLYGLSNSFGQLAHTATMMENLQSSLKQRDGELHQLQWELSRLQAERVVLQSEIAHLTIELENVKERLESNETVSKDFTELQQKYDALLEMYGEKVEETQELEFDLQDIKEMYKAQIDELLRQQRNP